MPRQRHWVNYGNGGDLVFITTTVLDFVHAFSRDELRTRMALAMLHQSERARAELHAYVVMPHHVHLLLRLPHEGGVSPFVRVLKQRCAEAVMPHLTAAEQKGLSEQTGLNGNTFWQRSFRSVVVVANPMFQQKMRYIHDNPVKAELVLREEDYRWSSAPLFAQSLWSPEEGLPYLALRESLGR